MGAEVARETITADTFISLRKRGDGLKRRISRVVVNYNPLPLDPGGLYRDTESGPEFRQVCRLVECRCDDAKQRLVNLHAHSTSLPRFSFAFVSIARLRQRRKRTGTAATMKLLG